MTSEVTKLINALVDALPKDKIRISSHCNNPDHAYWEHASLYISYQYNTNKEAWQWETEFGPISGIGALSYEDFELHNALLLTLKRVEKIKLGLTDIPKDSDS